MNKVSRTQGFTMVEVLIVVAMVAILAAIAYPSYNSSVRKSHRAEAVSILLEVASRQERFFGQSFAYADDMAALGYDNANYTTPGGRYEITVSAPTATSFIAQADPLDAQGDDACGILTLSNAGVKTAEHGTVETCW